MDDGDDEQDLRAALEAVLFLARQPLPSRRLSQLAGLADGSQARALVRRLNATYDAVGRAFQVKEIAGGYQMLTRPQFGRWLRRVASRPTPGRLSGPALETLAIVAYRQPIIRAEIEAIRGVGCGEMLRMLMERGLVKICGRRRDLGHPLEYATTRQFLELFGVPTLDALPRADKLRGPGLPPTGRRAAEMAATESDRQSRPDVFGEETSP